MPLTWPWCQQKQGQINVAITDAVAAVLPRSCHCVAFATVLRSPTATALTATAASILFISPDIFVITILALIALETTFLLPAKQTSWSPHQHSARLRIHPLAHVTFFRLFSAFLTIPGAFVSPWATLPILVISELCSRHLFFTSVQAPKMPGGLN